MRIGIVSSTIFSVPISGYGGLEVIAYHCARGLAEKGHEVYLFAPEGSSCPGVSVVPFGPPGQIDEKAAYGNYWSHLRGLDCVVDHSWSKWTYIGKEEGWLKAPILGVMHAPVNTMYQTLPNVEKLCFVCISDDQRSHFEALHGRQAKTAYNGIDLQHYKSLDIPRSDRFLFLARFSSIKGADLAIEACKRADVGLDLIGDTTITGEPEYFAKCQAMADGKQIRIVGGVSRGESVWWYSQAHCFLHPNMRFREPLGLAPLEAMACSLPVIAWRYGAMKETIKDGQTGYLVNSMDELVSVVKAAKIDPFYMGGSRERCREWASQFSLQQMIERYDTLIHEATKTGGW